MFLFFRTRFNHGWRPEDSRHTSRATWLDLGHYLNRSNQERYFILKVEGDYTGGRLVMEKPDGSVMAQPITTVFIRVNADRGQRYTVAGTATPCSLTVEHGPLSWSEAESLSMASDLTATDEAVYPNLMRV